MNTQKKRVNHYLQHICVAADTISRQKYLWNSYWVIYFMGASLVDICPLEAYILFAMNKPTFAEKTVFVYMWMLYMCTYKHI